MASTLLTVIVLAYLLSAIVCTPVVIIAWAMGRHIEWSRLMLAVGWGACAIVVFALTVRLAGA